MIRKIYPLGQAVKGLREKFGDTILDIQGKESEYTVRINTSILLEIANYLKGEGFNHLSFVTAIDKGDKFTLVYEIFSTFGKDGILLEVDVSRDKPEIDSVSSIWNGANWHEREIYDLFGISFKNHPDLRRIFMPDDWEGYPLRKDFTHENLVRKPDFY